LIDADVSQCVYVNGQSVCVEEMCVFLSRGVTVYVSVGEALKLLFKVIELQSSS